MSKLTIRPEVLHRIGSLVIGPFVLQPPRPTMQGC